MSTDWIPCELITVGQRKLVRWIHPGTKPLFTDPFFHHTVDALTLANCVQKLTPMDELLVWPARKAPAGFIFHVSRCGSTLVSRSLGSLARHRVISEASPVNQLLRSRDFDPDAKRLLLKGLIHALCGSASGTDCFFKFTSWNLLYLEHLLALFPDTPWIFVYRDPVDVLQSLQARPPRWAGHTEFFQDLGGQHAGGQRSLELVLERFFSAPLPHWNHKARAINYGQLPAAIVDISEHFSLTLDPTDQARMLRMGQFEAKQTGEVPFSARERAPPTDTTARASEPLNQLFNQWEAIRKTPVEATHAP